MYGPPPPDYPRATSSPTIILLASGLAGLVGLLVGVFLGMGVSEPAAPAHAPTVTVTIEDSTPPATTAPPTSSLSTGVPTATGAPPTSTGAPPTATGAPPTSSGGPLASNRTLVVGKDIQPGVYKTAGPAPGQPGCYWARLNATVASPAAVIAADMPKGPATVTILPTDKAFQTGGCAEWTKA